MINDLLNRLRQQRQQYGQGVINDAARQPIPGFTGPATSGAGVIPGMGMAQPVESLPSGGGTWGSAPASGAGGSSRFGNLSSHIGEMFSQLLAQPGVGMAPPQPPPLQPGGQVLQPFMASGPYGQQAAQLAGLLGQPHVGGIQNNMMLGNKSRLPFYRPVGK